MSARLLQAVAVEIIRRLWDLGRYRQNRWMQAVHDEWFEVWVEWRTQQTMKDLDQQIAQIKKDDTEQAPPVFSEDDSGAMQISHPTLGTMDPLDEL